MINIAVVEDDERQIEQTERYIRDFEKESGQTFNVTVFHDGLALLDRYKSVYDIIFMDIEMPDLDGMETAKKLRELDSAVIIIFMTNMQQYAIRGYEVEALDYMVKPVGYFTFALKLKKAIKKLGRSAEAFLNVPQENGVMRLDTSRIRYIEVINHRLVYHTDDGKYEARGSLTEIENKLSQYDFSRCNHCYLVNLRAVRGIRGNMVLIADEELQISRPKRKAFLDDLAHFCGRGGV